MEGFILNIIGTMSFGGVFLVIFFSVYYLYLRGAGEGMGEEDKNKNKRLGKRLGKRILK